MPIVCAGAGSTSDAIELEEAEWNHVMATNLRGPWLMAKAVGRRMRSAKRKGSIMTITSIAGLERSLLPLAIAYGTSKAAANHLTKVFVTFPLQDFSRENYSAYPSFHALRNIKETDSASVFAIFAMFLVVHIRRPFCITWIFLFFGLLDLESRISNLES